MEGGGVGKTARDTPQVQLSPNGHVTYAAWVIRPLSLAGAYTDTTPACSGTPTYNMGHIFCVSRACTHNRSPAYVTVHIYVQGTQNTLAPHLTYIHNTEHLTLARVGFHIQTFPYSHQDTHVQRIPHV